MGESGALGREVVVMMMPCLRRTFAKSGSGRSLRTPIIRRALLGLRRLRRSLTARTFARFETPFTAIRALRSTSFRTPFAFATRFRARLAIGAEIARLSAALSFTRFESPITILRRTAFRAGPALTFRTRLIGALLRTSFPTRITLRLFAPALFESRLVAFPALRLAGPICRSGVVAAGLGTGAAAFGMSVTRGAKLVHTHLAVAVTIEFAEHIGRLAHFLGIDRTVVIRIERGEHSRHRALSARTVRSRPAFTALAIRPRTIGALCIRALSVRAHATFRARPIVAAPIGAGPGSALWPGRRVASWFGVGPRAAFAARFAVAWGVGWTRGWVFLGGERPRRQREHHRGSKYVSGIHWWRFVS